MQGRVDIVDDAPIVYLLQPSDRASDNDNKKGEHVCGYNLKQPD